MYVLFGEELHKPCCYHWEGRQVLQCPGRYGRLLRVAKFFFDSDHMISFRMQLLGKNLRFFGFSSYRPMKRT